MQTTDIVGHVSDTAAHLAGLELTPADLNWAVDIPAGKRLLEWLAVQSPDNGDGRDKDKSTTLQSSLSPISLYQEELDLLALLPAGSSGKCTAPDPSNTLSITPASYALPSELRARAKSAESQTDLLERQTARLQHRLEFSKKAAKDLKHALNALRNQVQNVDETITEQQQLLTELSADADNRIDQHVNTALRALSDHSNSTSTEGPDVLRSQLASLTSSRAGMGSAVHNLYQDLDEGYNSLPTASELQRDAVVIHAKLKDVGKDPSRVDALVQMAYIEELEKMTKLLEESTRTGDTEAIAQCLEGSRLETAAPMMGVDVRSELEDAGRMDRFLLLKHHEEGLDDVIRALREMLVPTLQSTYDSLHARSTVAIETEALVSALIEELEDANDAVESVGRPLDTPTGSASAEDAECLLEAKIVELLKGLPTLRGEGPAILLDRSDVDAELEALAHGLSASRQAEERWTHGLRERLSRLSSARAPLLSAVYANSPVNTSPLFAPSVAQAVLQRVTSARADDLASSAARLQKETELSSRDKRKLGGFVEKWISG